VVVQNIIFFNFFLTVFEALLDNPSASSFDLFKLRFASFQHCVRRVGDIFWFGVRFACLLFMICWWLGVNLGICCAGSIFHSAIFSALHFVR